MSGQSSLLTRWPIVLMIPIIMVISGCAAKTKMIGDSEAGLVLKYQMPENQNLKYYMSSKSSQDLEAAGKSIKIDTDETRHFSVRAAGKIKDGFKVGLTIDSMKLKLGTPRGEISPDMSGVVGKSFIFTFSDLGKETDFPEGESIQYELYSGKKQSVITGFHALFPDLPQRPIRIGDTWITADTVVEKSGDFGIEMVFISENKLDRVMKIDGKKCVVINGVVTGSVNGKGQEEGVDLVTTATITGTDTWYFAYNEGIFVRMESNGIAVGKIVGSGAQSMSIPMKRNYSIETRLVGKP